MSPYRLPELAPSVAESTVALPPFGRRHDPEAVLSFFEEHQEQLSDADRVELLLRAARMYRPEYGSHRAFLKSGPGEAVIDLTLRAARNAENAETVGLRTVRVLMAQRVHPLVGIREAVEVYKDLRAIDLRTVEILCPSGANPEHQRAALAKALELEGWLREKIGHLYIPYDPKTQIEDIKAGRSRMTTLFSLGEQREWTLAEFDRTLPKLEKWLDEHKVPRLAQYGVEESPHVNGEGPTNPAVCETLTELHEQNVQGFIGATGFGVARQMRPDQRQVYQDAYGDYWRVVMSQLVSVIDRDVPVAYDIDQPSGPWIMMKKLPAVEVAAAEVREIEDPALEFLREKKPSAGVPVRELSDFESGALKKSLKISEPVVSREGRRIRMVAPLLARSACLRCHDVELGEPLGAFSYAMEPGPEAADWFEKRAKRAAEWRREREGKEK